MASVYVSGMTTHKEWKAMSKSVFTCLVLLVLVTGKVQASIATNANQLPDGLTTYVIRGYENAYDSSGNLVTTQSLTAGDTLEGVYVITLATNQFGTANYFPQAAGAVEITGLFDTLVGSPDAAGNFTLTADTTSTVGQRAFTGAQFQTSYGSNAMIALYQNNNNALTIGSTGNGLAGLTLSQAFALASSGSYYASFGQKGTWGASNGYYWAANVSGSGTTSFAASLGIIQNDTSFSSNSYLPITQSLPGGLNPDSVLASIANSFALQGTVSSSDANLTNTPFEFLSTGSGELDLGSAPEPSGILVVGGLFGLWGLGQTAFRRLRKV
jgi:hypothetical protein